MIIDILSNMIGDYISSNCSISQSDKEKAIYALKAILGEVIKIIILILLFYILHRVKFFIFSLVILISIRTFSGGIHLKTFNQCLLFSAFIFIITSLVAPIMPKTYSEIYYGIAILDILSVAVKSPCPSPKRPIKNFNRLIRLKILSIFFTIIWLGILFFYITDTFLFNCGLATITIQSIQLILSHREVLK
ncbi:accessory gene regulator B family protein [Clostridium sp. P21]|uniref:Accessory gene regulator B family protein n=1 Tax=Clostridium muellerianum TaxID=2716538 RepID=A0A7Y0EE04_9CLOT|nr:accessory gene regulator B family protein [Clostridium muellerianum]NMM61774.1 accessory gene regulator B family protein [Clostridium muellerianum]